MSAEAVHGAPKMSQRAVRAIPIPAAAPRVPVGTIRGPRAASDAARAPRTIVWFARSTPPRAATTGEARCTTSTLPSVAAVTVCTAEAARSAL